MGERLQLAEVIDAGPPLPSQYWQALLVVQRQTPQFTRSGEPQAPPPELAAGAELSISAAPPVPLHHWQVLSGTHLQTPQSTMPARPQEAKERPRAVPLVLLIGRALL